MGTWYQDTRRLAGSMGGLTTRARHDPREPGGYTQAGRDAFLARFEKQVDSDGVLPEQERYARALAARKVHMRELALKSAKARRDEARLAAETAKLLAAIDSAE